MTEIDARQERDTLPFVAFWILILIPIIVSSRIGDPTGDCVVLILFWLLPAILGTTGVFLLTRKKNPLWPNALVTLALLTTTPAFYINGFPVQLFPLMISPLLGDPDSLAFLVQHSGTPIRNVCGILLVLVGSTVAAVLLARAASRFANGAVRKLGHRLHWLMAFPIYLATFVGFHVIVILNLLIVRALGLYPAAFEWFSF